MGAMDLLKKTQKAFVESDTLGTGEPIVYTHDKTFTVEEINAFVGEDEFNQDERDSKKVNTVAFANVVLTEEPTKLDTILYDGRAYEVREWVQNAGMYTIIAENDKRNKVSSRNFKR